MMNKKRAKITMDKTISNLARKNRDQISLLQVDYVTSTEVNNEKSKRVMCQIANNLLLEKMHYSINATTKLTYSFDQYNFEEIINCCKLLAVKKIPQMFDGMYLIKRNNADCAYTLDNIKFQQIGYETAKKS